MYTTPFQFPSITHCLLTPLCHLCYHSSEFLRRKGDFMLHIDIRSRTPIFEQIKNQITELAVSGALKPHDGIPSIRALAHDLKLNVNTVKRAFAELEGAGVIYTLAGRGSFIAETAVDNAHLKTKAMAEIKTAVAIGRANGLTLDAVIEEVRNIYGEGRIGNA